jgi:hypothetical protein
MPFALSWILCGLVTVALRVAFATGEIGVLIAAVVYSGRMITQLVTRTLDGAM